MESRLELKESWKRNKEKNHQRDGGKIGTMMSMKPGGRASTKSERAPAHREWSIRLPNTEASS